MVGTKPVWANTLSCYQCIRAGYYWCSIQWYYQSPTTTYDENTEKGKCCFNTEIGEYAAGGGTPAKDIANIINCPAKYTNANDGVSAIIPNIVVSWCSYNTNV